MRPSAIGSPPVQPSSSSTSGTGSVRTMWLDATAWASRKPGKPAVALFTASTAALARTRPRGVTATASTPSRRTGVRSCSRTPASTTFARSPSASRAGWTVADVRRIAPPRKPASQRARSSAAVARRISSGAPSASQASIASSDPSSCASLVATTSVGAARYQASTPSRSHQSPIPCTPRSDALTTSSARSSPTRSRRMGTSSQSVETKPPLRPLGPCPARPASSTSTSHPGSIAFSCQAVQSPRYPPPTTTTSAVVSPSSGAVVSTGSVSSSHQPYLVCRTPSTGSSLTGAILRLRAVAVAQLVEPRVVVPVVAGSSPVRHPDSDRADEGPPADHALRPIADALAEAAVGGDEPPGRGELRRKLDDRVVGVVRSDEIGRVLGRRRRRRRRADRDPRAPPTRAPAGRAPRARRSATAIDACSPRRRRPESWAPVWAGVTLCGGNGPVAQRIERQASNLRAEVRLLPGPFHPPTGD